MFDSPPALPGGLMTFIHDHVWTEVGAQRNPNGTWCALFACSLCPDIGVGGYVGPIPSGWCSCGWVQSKWPRKKCEECGRTLADSTIKEKKR